MRKTENSAVIQGYVYKHKLEEKVSKAGVNYFRGKIDVATDDDCLNIVTVTYNYIAPTFGSGKVNSSYDAVKQIMNGKTVVANGIAEATKVRLTPSLSVLDYPDSRNNYEMTKTQRIEGGFVSIVPSLPQADIDRNKFKVDALIYNVVPMEDDTYLKLNAYVFDYTGALKPVDFTVRSTGGIQYFSSLEISNANPLFTSIWGQFKNIAGVAPETESNEVAFGEAIVSAPRSTREWVVTGAAKSAYELGDSTIGITGEELKEALAAREMYIATEKKRGEDYRNSQAGGATGTATTAAAGAFNF